uniref:UDP-N-acetylglucosamine--N-acetylmuramyl-(pentapeptide) pyrophosphoryl-undecaprenol N-acetylglucosamine transferase n=1 Tax=Candidatus Aschnera chinzeii TaxID=1485666 RepID=A0AAT9G4I5_9ENTR|nr:MAG: undecaprenyldiphospho-muramoylpentapeptide beta-N-acetylglucosaminyltransferase [Candidatus Aschnera chinzeii]
MNITKRLIIMGGGTGGHIFSGLEIAKYLIQRGWEVSWLGAYNKMESIIVPRYKIKINFINISALRNKNIIKQLLSIITIIKAIKEAKSIIQKKQPNIVLGMGGYVSGPGGIAAWLCNIPLVIHEQNAIVGLTNRWLSKIAKHILQAFPNTIDKAYTVGNPVRQKIIQLPSPKIRYTNRTGAIRILVLGGSQGSNILNKIFPQISSKLTRKVIIWHQTGLKESSKTKFLYKKFYNSFVKYKINTFINNIDKAYLWADIAICRSGALTVSEISAVGLAAIFVPFANHKDQQQYFNALPLAKINAAKIIKESKNLIQSLINILNNISRYHLLEMAKKAQTLFIPNTVINIETILNNIIKTNNIIV